MLRGLLASIPIASASKALPFVVLRPGEPRSVCLFCMLVLLHSRTYFSGHRKGRIISFLKGQVPPGFHALAVATVGLTNAQYVLLLEIRLPWHISRGCSLALLRTSDKNLKCVENLF